MTTHRGVVGGDVHQHLRGAPAAHVSVAVPHAADQVGLSRGGAETARGWMSELSSGPSTGAAACLWAQRGSARRRAQPWEPAQEMKQVLSETRSWKPGLEILLREIIRYRVRLRLSSRTRLTSTPSAVKPGKLAFWYHRSRRCLGAGS